MTQEHNVSEKALKIDLGGRISAAKSRLDALAGLRRKVGIVRMWPEQAVAEHENIERFRTALNFIGVDLVKIDRYGIIIKSPNQRVTAEDVDFVIHLHFETGKIYDVTSVAAMWNPPHFYYDWGFERFWSNQMSHDVFAYTGSKEIMGMLRASRGTDLEASTSLLNHTLADPIYAPTAKANYKTFYCGINWEKISGKKGRHDAVLKSLDALNLVEIYGPTTLQGKPVWDGYAGYRGPLPFDGRTIIRKISEAGTCLVLSSEAHIESDVMSNRLFEALAAGAVVIGDEHPFIPKAIGDNFVLVHSSLDADTRAQKIAAAIADFNDNPEKAQAMAVAAQQYFLEKYFFCDQLVDLYEAVDRFKQHTAHKLSTVTKPIVDLVVQPMVQDAKSITETLGKLHASFNSRANIILVVPTDQVEWYRENFGHFAQVFGAYNAKTNILHPYECLNLIGDNLQCEKVAFLLGLEEMFADTFISACIDLKGRAVGRTGHVLQHADQNGDFHFDFRSGSASLEEHNDVSIGSIIFDSAWLKSKIPFFSLHWKDICNSAETEDEGVVEFLGTTCIVNLKTYEAVCKKGRPWTKSVLDATKLIDLVTRDKAPLSDNVVLRRPAPDRKHYRNINGKAIVAEIKDLPLEQKWSLTLALYKSVPIPGWIRKLITTFRKGVGIR